MMKWKKDYKVNSERSVARQIVFNYAARAARITYETTGETPVLPSSPPEKSRRNVSKPIFFGEESLALRTNFHWGTNVQN